MLGWLAAAAAPILIHLWNKRKYREVPWAAMEYLLAAMRKNARRIQLEQWLLLAVRTLLIVLIVLAVAQPYAEQLGLSFAAGQRTLKVLVIDGSYSMGYKPTDKTRFEKAKQLAAQIVEESRQGDAFTLVLMGSPPTVVVGTPAMEAGAVSGRDRQSEVAARRSRSAGHAGQGRRNFAAGRIERAGPERGVFLHRFVSQYLAADRRSNGTGSGNGDAAVAGDAAGAIFGRWLSGCRGRPA